MIKFEYQYRENGPRVTVELLEDSTLSEVLEQFEGFLKAAGYSFDGTVNIVGPDEIEEEKIENRIEEN